MRYAFYGLVTNIMRRMPYEIRFAYWTLMFYYNRNKYPSITLDLYTSYAK